VGHISAKTDHTAAKTPKEWLPFGSQVGEQCNAWARRGDIVAYVGPGAGEGMAAALFKPGIAEMEIDVDMAFEGAKPEFLGDFTKRTTHFDHPAVAGAVLHEAMHARHTKFDLKGLTPVAKENPYLADLVMWFEETRIELRGRRHYPRNRSFMRACALKLSLRELPDPDTLAARGSMGMSQLLLISAARVDIGVLDYDDVKTTTDAIKAHFGDKLYDRLRAIWWKAQRENCDRDFAPLLKHARDWLDALKEEGHEPPPPIKMMVMSISGVGDPDAGDGEGEPGDEGMGEMMRGLVESLGEEAENTEVDAQSEAYAQEGQEGREESAKGKAAKAKEDKTHRDEAAKVFGKGTAPSSVDETNSRLTTKRDPNVRERSAAVTLSKLLDKARYRERVVVPTTSIAPPGRLRGRAAVQAAADRAAGRHSAVPMWKGKRRINTEDPVLKVGLLVDISGSMSGAMQPMATTAWVLSEAVRRIQGKVAAVYYGNSCFPVLKPGQHFKEVHVYTAPDGTERFTQAFQAMDGAMGLLSGSGARLLVIVSDLYYTSGEREALRRYVKRCHEAGVAVVHYHPDDTDSIKGTLGKLAERSEIISGTDAVKVAEAMGQAAIRALEAIGTRA
jgi:hypothetical protein